MNIKPGQQYEYSVNAQTFNTDKGGYMTVTYYDAVGRAVSTEKTDMVSGTNETWQTLRGTSTAPVNAEYAVLSLCADGQGKVWFANAEFAAKNGISARSLEISGAETVEIPSKNRYNVRVIDASGAAVDTIDITMTAVCPAGVSFDGDTGVLTVSDSAKGGESVVISAEYDGLTVSKTVKTLTAATAVSITGSGAVTVSQTSVKTAEYSLLNQAGQKLDPAKVKWSVTGSGVSINNGVLTVERNAAVQSITIRAEYNGLLAEKKVSLTATSASSGSGGGGGGSISGLVGKSGAASGGSLSEGAMGNFSTAVGGSTGESAAETVNGEQIIPQPDPAHFTQGMDNIGGFNDIGRVGWAQKAIVALSAVGVVNGKEDGRFFPDDNVTRAEFVKILIGALEYSGRIDTSNASCSFSDVAEDAWYYTEIALAVNNGIVQGISDTEFAPDANITRQDMAVMIERAARVAALNIPDGAELIFTDASEISDYAADAVRTISKAGIINGFEDGTFSPKSNATRAQAAVVIYRSTGGRD